MYTQNSLLKNHWKIKNYDERESLLISQRFNISPMIAKLLNIKNINLDEIDQFLNPNLKESLPDPYKLKDMKKSVNRIIKSINNDEIIGIIADYDVDGATSAAIICKFFQSINQKYILKIPSRLKDGYGPNEEILNELKKKKIDLLLTLDCGTNSQGIIDKKKYLDFDTIVIDHHISENTLPETFSIINPNRYDENNIYKDLAAVGVTFLFILAMRKELRNNNFFDKKKINEPNLLNYLDLVALGTVCDVVNLSQYNRMFVIKGIEIIHKRKNEGIKTIIDNSKINHPPTVTDLSFIIGPQLNSASRVDDSTLSSKLLISNDIIEIESISRKLFIFNEKRKLIEKQIYEEALKQINNQKNNNIIIVKGKGWHKGVLGIVASRLVEKFNKPSIVFSFDEYYGTGSARSIDFIDLGNIILKAKNKGFLLDGGGHKMAAGLKISITKYDDFLDYIINIFKNYDSINFKKIIHFDSLLTLDEINENLLNNIEQLEPFGSSNPEPKFIIKNVSINFAKIIKEKHILFNIIKDSDNSLKAICFNCVDNELGQNLLNHQSFKFDLACTIKRDIYQGKIKPQIIIYDAIKVY